MSKYKIGFKVFIISTLALVIPPAFKNFNQDAHAAVITGSFTTADISAGSFKYNSLTPFAVQDNSSALYLPVGNGFISFTYKGVSSTFAMTKILVAPGVPDGHLGYEDVLQFDFIVGSVGDYLQLVHTPASTLPSYKLVNLDPELFPSGSFGFAGLIDGKLTSIYQPLGHFIAVSEPQAGILFSTGILLLFAATHRARRYLR